MFTRRDLDFFDQPPVQRPDRCNYRHSLLGDVRHEFELGVNHLDTAARRVCQPQDATGRRNGTKQRVFEAAQSLCLGYAEQIRRLRDVLVCQIEIGGANNRHRARLNAPVTASHNPLHATMGEPS